MKRNGAKTSPCRISVETSKGSEKFQSTNTALLELMYNALMALTTATEYRYTVVPQNSKHYLPVDGIEGLLEINKCDC